MQNSAANNSWRQRIQVLRIFLPFAGGYFLSYLFRVVNAVIAPNLVADIGVGPSALGLLSGAYFIAFASFQLPLGILLDRFGPRKVEAVLLLFAALGAFLFAGAQSVVALVIARAFIGFGVSSCLMAAFKTYTFWFRRERLPMINGIQMASGGLGALAATAPVEMALGYTDWRGVFNGLALLTILAALLVYFVVPGRNTGRNVEPLHSQLRGLREIFTSLSFWRIAPLTTMSQSSLIAIQGLWAGPWLDHVAGLERDAVAFILCWVAVAMIAGFISLGAVAERLARRGIPLILTSVAGMTFFMFMQAVVLLAPVTWSLPVWIIFGFSGTSGILNYAVLTESFPVRLSGRVTTSVNLLVFIAAFSSQWMIGAIIELWPPAADGSLAAPGFRAGFTAVLVLQVIGLVWFLIATKKLHSSPSANP
ncbi:MAG: MFS transporter [Desulfobulbus propionicus]|nr:MAG: MFS transporter [Desulfobulbus propionicus]